MDENQIIKNIDMGYFDEVELLELVTENNYKIAIAVAESKYATEPILDIASHDKDRKIRLAALNNKNIGIDSIKFLIKDEDYEISQLAKEKLVERSLE
jgi:hypothetical protein